MTPSRLARRAVGAAAAVGTAVALVLGTGGSPAASAPVDVLLSFDGVHFSPALDGSMFDQHELLIPGGSVSAPLWIRNPTDRPAELRVSLRDVIIPSADYATGVLMSAWDSGSDSTRTAWLAETAECEVVLPPQEVAAGATIKMTFSFAMDDLTGASGQDESAGMDVMVSMRDAEAGAFAASACDDAGALISAERPPPAAMASTGAELPVPLLATGGVLIGVGAFLLAARRSRKSGDS